MASYRWFTPSSVQVRPSPLVAEGRSPNQTAASPGATSHKRVDGSPRLFTTEINMRGCSYFAISIQIDGESGSRSSPYRWGLVRTSCCRLFFPLCDVRIQVHLAKSETAMPRRPSAIAMPAALKAIPLLAQPGSRHRLFVNPARHEAKSSGAPAQRNMAFVAGGGSQGETAISCIPHPRMHELTLHDTTKLLLK